MPDLTDQEHLPAEAELRFARWIVEMGGWVHADTVAGKSADAEIAAIWLADERLCYANGGRIVELTGYGREWCRQYGTD